VSSLGYLYERVYTVLCGRHPRYRPWHFQWMFLRGAHRWQKIRMGGLHGCILDLGCREKPYADWLEPGRVGTYIGADVIPGAGVDVLIDPMGHWPFADESFDAIVCTQVLEHVGNRDTVVDEMSRILKSAGTILVTVPFLYPAHGLPHDHVRFTSQGLTAVLEKNFEVVESLETGGAGTTLSTLLLTWIESSFNRHFVTRLLKGLLLPLWIVFCLCVNVLGLCLDRIDGTGTHYANVCLAAAKRTSPDV